MPDFIFIWLVVLVVMAVSIAAIFAVAKFADWAEKRLPKWAGPAFALLAASLFLTIMIYKIGGD
jgi:L-asparagine transporter-like permease